MSCPYVHLCQNAKCLQDSMCQDKTYWSHYWRKKAEKEQAQTGITKKDRRKIRKLQKKIKGIRPFNRDEKEKARQEIYKDCSPCVKTTISGLCDKHQACSILSQCIAQRFAHNDKILVELKGPRTIKNIVKILQEHDPFPMKSYYLKSRE